MEPSAASVASHGIHSMPTPVTPYEPIDIVSAEFFAEGDELVLMVDLDEDDDVERAVVQGLRLARLRQIVSAVCGVCVGFFALALACA